MPKRKHVGLVVESLEACGGRVLDGIARWLHTNPGWRMAVFDGGRHELAQLARDWEGDGMVCTTPNPELQVALESLNIPIGNVSGRYHNHNSVSVMSDDAACGQLAADHFVDRGFQRFCFVGTSEPQIRQDLATGFLERCRQKGGAVTTFTAPLGREKDLARWLKIQPRPLAIFASSDRRAAGVLEACHLAELPIPEEVAVLGIGNHSQLCDLCTPPLSSVDCDMETRGFEAAALLFRLMAGDSAPWNPVKIPPAGVVTRRSSDTYAFDDAELSNALRFIRENASCSIKVRDVLAATSISRRSLENRFRRHFSRSLHEEIWRVHFERAKQLLTTTDLGLQKVAERSGFRTASALANLFKQRTGLTPRTYRAEYRR